MAQSKFSGNGYKIIAQGDRAEILIYGLIGDSFFGESITAKQFVEQLNELHDVQTLDVRINSQGGSFFDSIAIYNALRRFSGTVKILVDGLAGSGASVIAMAGATIEIAEGGFFMIHNALGALPEPVHAPELRRFADSLDKLSAEMRDIYARKTGQRRDKIAQMLEAETWLNADEALELGFATMKGKQAARRVAACSEQFLTKAPPEARALFGAPPAKPAGNKTDDESFGLSVQAKLLAMKHGLSAKKTVRQSAITAQFPSAAAALKVGDRVRVLPGKEHDSMTANASGTIQEIASPALMIQFDGMDEPHKWYVAEELEKID